MEKFNFHNRGQSLIGIIIILIIVGLIAGGLYYLSKQIPEISEIAEKSTEEKVTPPAEEELPKEEVPPKPEKPVIQKCTDGTPYGQCSTTKPKYCENGNLINKASLCGCPSGYMVYGNQCKVLISCTKIIYNGDPKDKLDVIFIPLGFENIEEFESLVLEHIDKEGRYKGLLYYDPLKSNSNKFNFYRIGGIPSGIENKFIQSKCRYYNSVHIFECIRDIKNYLSNETDCIYDKVIIIFNNLPPETGGGWAETLGGTVSLTIAREYPPFETQGHMETVHEFGHLLGLGDSNVGSGISPWDPPNCDVAGCPKWCRDYIKTPSGNIYELCKDLTQNDCQENVNCVWRSTLDNYYKTQCVPLDDQINIGIDCLGGTGCYHNCDGVGGWRPSNYVEPGLRPASLMFYMMNALGFDAVDRRYLESVLSKYK